MTQRITDIARGLVALVAIAVLLLGLPWFLWRLGGYPGVSLLDAVRDPLASDNTRAAQLLAGTLGIIAWLCWLQVAYALVVETIAAARGRVANRAPILPGIQAAAARLVTAATLVLSSFGPTATAMVAPLAPVAVLEPALATSANRMPAAPLALQSDVDAEAGETYTTSGRDTFWSMAETMLSDGLRWREIRDANVGQRMSDGTIITSTTEDVAGRWKLRLPADAVVPLADESGTQSDEDGSAQTGEWIAVEKGDHFWSIAEDALEEAWGRDAADAEVTPYWSEVMEENEERLLPPEDVNLVYPEQRFHLPAPPADPTLPVDRSPIVEAEAEPEPTTVILEPEESATTSTTTATTRPEVTTVPSPLPGNLPATAVEQVVPSDSNTIDLSALALGLGGVGVGAGALAVTLRRRRAHQAAKRKPETTLAPPPEQANEYERRIRPVADTEAARWVDATNKLITGRLAQHKAHRMPAVVAMRAGRFGVEVLLDEPCAPIEGFVSGNNDNSAWRLHPDLELRMIEAETEVAQPYCPALVTVGTTEAGDLLLDLEQLGVLSVEGDDDDVAAWYRSIAASIGSTGWSQLCEVVMIGGVADVARFERVSVPDDPEAWAEQTNLAMRKLHERLTATPYEHRVSPGEIFHPTLVLIAGDNAELARELSEAASLVNSPLAVIAACPLAVAERVHLDPRNSTLEPMGVDFVPILTPAAEAEAVADLLDAADSAEVIEVEDEAIEVASAVDPGREPVEAVIERIMAQKPIEVRLLCAKPAVAGLSVDPPAKQLSVICYLAFHRSVSSQRLRDTFWPTATSRKTADNAISQVRSVLGLTADGENRLAQAINSGEYEVSDDVGCDWVRAKALIDETTDRPAVEQMELLKSALGLIEGQVGADAPCRQFSWLLNDHAVYGDVEHRLLDAASRLGEVALENGDLSTAAEASATGLTVVPGSEAMYRLQMRAAATAGDHRCLADAYNAAQRSAELIGPWVELEAETVKLYQSLIAPDHLAAG